MQHREFVPVADLSVDGQRWLSWDEAVEHEVPVTTARLRTGGAAAVRGRGRRG